MIKIPIWLPSFVIIISVEESQEMRGAFKLFRTLSNDSHYCLINLKHVMCEGFNSSNLKCEILDMTPRDTVNLQMGSFFNALRSLYATGTWPGDSSPAQIPNMRGLTWDDELADFAEKWVSQCPSQQDANRDTKRFKVAQIVFTDVGKYRPTVENALTELIDEKHTFHIIGPPNGKNIPNKLYSQYDPRQRMSILTNPHVRYFGCAIARVNQKNVRDPGLREWPPVNGHHAPSPPATNPQRETTFSTNSAEETTSRAIRLQAIQQVLQLTNTTAKDFLPNDTQPDVITAKVKFEWDDFGFPNVSASSIKLRRNNRGQPDNKTKSPHASEFPKEIVIVCNFGPVEESYEKNQLAGPACSACPQNTFCDEQTSYDGLCWDKTLFPGDLSETPTNATGDEKCYTTCDSGDPHILCTYKGPTNEFEQVIPLGGATMASYVLVWHNLVRDAIAEGRHNRDLPLSSNMREMVWNKRLEESALMWSMQCKPHKDDCRDEEFPDFSEKLVSVNQLVLQKPWDVYEDGYPSFEDDILSEWGVGFKYIQEEDISFFKPDHKNDSYKTFVQLIWAKTFMIGCAMSLCSKKVILDEAAPTNVTFERRNHSEKVRVLNNFVDLDAVRLGRKSARNKGSSSFITAVCNYAPGVDRDGGEIYNVGGPCSGCEKIDPGHVGNRGMYCSEEYVNLCAGADGGGFHFTIIGFAYLFYVSI